MVGQEGDGDASPRKRAATPDGFVRTKRAKEDEEKEGEPKSPISADKGEGKSGKCKKKAKPAAKRTSSAAVIVDAHKEGEPSSSGQAKGKLLKGKGKSGKGKEKAEPAETAAMHLLTETLQAMQKNQLLIMEKLFHPPTTFSTSSHQ